MVEFISKNDNYDAFMVNWQRYLDNNLASYKYLPIYVEYMLFYSTHLVTDESFVVVEDGKCVGICFLPIEKYEGHYTISLADGYTIAPLAINERIEKEIFAKIENIAIENDIKKIKFYLDPLVGEYSDNFNYLRKYAFIDSSSSDTIVDLRFSKDELWTKLRKSYKPLINGILKNNNFRIVKVDYKSPNLEIHEKYRQLHRKCAGRETRVKDTFDKQFEMLENDFASLFGLLYMGEFIGFNYFFHYQKTVVYASGADDPDYEEKKMPIYHAILWSAFLYYKERDFEFIQLSQPSGYHKIGGFDDYMDEKQINISLFKRGLGAKMVPLHRGVRYYDKKLLKLDIEKFMERVASEYV